MNGNYVIAGDTEKYKNCLICCVAPQDKEKRLEDVKASEEGKRYTNIRIEFVPANDCWWLQGGLD